MSQPQIYTTAVNNSGNYETFSLVTGSTPVQSRVRLLGLIYENISGSNAYVQVFDGNSQPTTGAFPLVWLQISAGNQASVDFGSGQVCYPFNTGIVVGLSSTPLSYTPVANSLGIVVFWTK